MVPVMAWMMVSGTASLLGYSLLYPGLRDTRLDNSEDKNLHRKVTHRNRDGRNRHRVGTAVVDPNGSKLLGIYLSNTCTQLASVTERDLEGQSATTLAPETATEMAALSGLATVLEKVLRLVSMMGPTMARLLDREMGPGKGAVSDCNRCDLGDPNTCLDNKRKQLRLAKATCCKWYFQRTHSSQDDHWGRSPNKRRDIHQSSDCMRWGPLKEKRKVRPRPQRLVSAMVPVMAWPLVHI